MNCLREMGGFGKSKPGASWHINSSVKANSALDNVFELSMLGSSIFDCFDQALSNYLTYVIYLIFTCVTCVLLAI